MKWKREVGRVIRRVMRLEHMAAGKAPYAIRQMPLNLIRDSVCRRRNGPRSKNFGAAGLCLFPEAPIERVTLIW